MAGIRYSSAGKSDFAFLCNHTLSDEFTGNRVADIYGQPDSTTGHDDRLLYHFSGNAFIRFCLSIQNMPEPVQWLTLFNPMRYYMVIIRGIFLKGTGIDILWPQLVAMGGLGFMLLSLAVKRFHKKLI